MSTIGLSNDDNNLKNNNVTHIINHDINHDITDERLFLGNFFGLFPEKYLKFFNFLFAQIICTLSFAFIYYMFMVFDYKNNFFVQPGYKKTDFLKNPIFVAIIMSINFQTTVAYVDIKIKSVMMRFLVTLQTIIACLLAFLFLL